MKASQDPKTVILELAKEVDVDGLRVATVDPPQDLKLNFERAIQKGFFPVSPAIQKRFLEKMTNPRSHLKKARSVICAYICYHEDDLDVTDPTKGSIAPYTRANYYGELKSKLEKIAQHILERFGARSKVFSCYVGLAEKPLAVRAGLGFYGKNGIIQTLQHGSLVVLGEILTELELEPDSPLDDTCGDCDACIRACPTNAIVEPYTIDVKRCIQYISERRGTVPVEIRELWDNRLYGCFTCQAVCPRNRNIPKVKRTIHRGRVGSSIDLNEIIHMTRSKFYKRFSDNQIGMREPNVIRRNAIIAAGNSRNSVFLSSLTSALGDPDPMIRLHALWSISRILGRQAMPVLEDTLRIEWEPSVRAEAKRLLDGLGNIG